MNQTNDGRMAIDAGLDQSDLSLKLYKKILLNSAEHEIFLLINVKMPTIVGILTFMSKKNSIIGLSEPEKC